MGPGDFVLEVGGEGSSGGADDRRGRRNGFAPTARLVEVPLALRYAGPSILDQPVCPSLASRHTRAMDSRRRPRGRS
jgi:hypothetical protein